MKSPKDMRIIQIDITNACVHECSNCTRFCGHHKKPFFMDFEMFKRAIDSLEGFDRCIGVMGGEPTIHPEFERFAEYIGEKYPSKYDIKSTREPVRDFATYVHDKNYLLDESLNDRKGPGLWTSVSRQYNRYFEVIQDTFSFQNINDHANPSLHQPLLVSRKELGITDDEWIPLRDKCWIQNEWSASITPKGAFFCEVAAALDMLFDGPGGWKVEKDWWKRTPDEFGEQLKWCEICGGAVMHSGRLSSEEIDDISPRLYEKLQKVNSPKISRGKYMLMNPQKPNELEPMPDTINRYLTNFEERINKDNKSVYPLTIDAGIIENEDLLDIYVNKYAEVFNKIIYVSDNVSELQKKYPDSKNIKFVEITGTYGNKVNKIIMESNHDWIYIANDDRDTLRVESLRKYTINPGVIYKISERGDSYLINANAKAIKTAGFDTVAYSKNMSEIINIWPKDKYVTIKDDYDKDINPDIQKWNSIVSEIIESNIITEVQKEKLEKCMAKIKSDYEKA